MGDDPAPSISIPTPTISRSAKSRSCTAGADNKGAPIRWEWRAAHFADYLLQTKLQKRTSGLHVIYSVTIQLVPNH